MRFEYSCLEHWPPLAWIARCAPGASIAVWHGRRVEIRENWFCEAAWPGPFESGDFDQTDLLAGTGGRIRGGSAKFVAPGNTIDRIVSLRTPRELLVSNSVPCLLAVSGATIDPSYPRYYEDFATIVRGLSAFKKTLETSLGPVRLTMYGSLLWDGREATSMTRESVERDFGSFAKYEGFLRESLAALSRNIADAARTNAYRLLATTSSGYDSPAVAALARTAGCDEALCIDKDRFGNAEEGDRIASLLGLRPIRVGRDAWRNLDGAEIPFIAADGTSEAVPLSGAGSELAGRVLLTGYHGDKVWSKHAYDLTDQIVRGDSSGLSMSEYRLWTGFIHCPVAFWGVRQIRDINRLSNSEEMRPWDVPSDYSRPIPRRIVESAGVPREAFGTAKRVTAVAFSEFLTPGSLDRYRAWLVDNRKQWLKHGRLPPPLGRTYERMSRAAADGMERVLRRTPLLWRFAPSLDSPSRFRRHAFAWAVSEVSARYRRHMPEGTAQG